MPDRSHGRHQASKYTYERTHNSASATRVLREAPVRNHAITLGSRHAPPAKHLRSLRFQHAANASPHPSRPTPAYLVWDAMACKRKPSMIMNRVVGVAEGRHSWGRTNPPRMPVSVYLRGPGGPAAHNLRIESSGRPHSKEPWG